MARKYQLKFAKDGPPVDESFLSFIDGMLSELNISPQVAQQMADRWQQYVGTRIAAENSNNERALATLKTELGAGYAQAIAAGQRGARTLGLGKAELDALDGSLGVVPGVKLMIAIGKRFSAAGTTPAAGNSGDDPAFSSAESALAEIAKLQASKAFADKLFNPKAEGHAEVKERWNQLHARAYPTPEPAAAPASPAAASGDDKAAAAKAKIEAWLGDAVWMQSIGDKSHPSYRENREQWESAHAELGLVR